MVSPSSTIMILTCSHPSDTVLASLHLASNSVMPALSLGAPMMAVVLWLVAPWTRH